MTDSPYCWLQMTAGSMKVSQVLTLLPNSLNAVSAKYTKSSTILGEVKPP